MNVLSNQGFVELIDRMGNDMSVVRAARVSYAGDDDIGRAAELDQKLIRYLIKNKHTSPFEHVVFTFHIKAPIFVARQWMRHRTWSFNEISARYTKLDDDYYLPDVWRRQSKKNKQVSTGEILDQDAANGAYMKLVSDANATYDSLLRMKVSREMARMVLPVGVFTRFYATVDLHNLLHFLELRNHGHAQHEIQEYAQAIEQLIEPYVKWTLEAWRDVSA